MALFGYHRLDRKIFDNKLFGFLVKSLQIAGYVMDEKQNYKLWHTCRSAIFTVAMVVCSTLGFIKLMTRDITPLCVSTACIYLTTSIAYINLFFQRQRLSRMFSYLQEDMDKLFINSDKIEGKMLDETCRFIFNVRMVIFGPTFLAVGILTMEVFFKAVIDPDSVFNYLEIEMETGQLALLLKVYPFREVHDDLFLGLIFPFFALYIGALLVPLWPALIAGLMSYFNLKWRIMHKRMSEMDVSKVILEPSESIYYSLLVNENDKTNYLRKMLCKCCVNEQVRIYRFMKQLEELICIPVFADFTVYSIAICFVLYEMGTGSATNLEFVYMCVYQVVIATTLWLYHWNGTLVSENSYAMCFAIYSSDWYTYSFEVKQMVRMIMVITADPLEIKAFFITLKISTFIDIIRAAYSYFSILRRLS